MARSCHVDGDGETSGLSSTFSEGVKLRQHEGLGSQTALNKRSMVLDEECFEDAFLRCAVCREIFNESERQPRMLPCHHSFCLRCMTVLFKTEAEHRYTLAPGLRGLSTATAVTVHCPTCRASFVTNEDSLTRLPTDHRIVQLMDFVRLTDRYTVNFCSKHPLQPLNFFCDSCIRPVCRDCTVLDHKEKDGHLVLDLEEALKKYSPVVDKAIEEMNSESVSMDEKCVALDGTVKSVDKMKSELMHQVHSVFGRLRAALCEREKEVEAMAEAALERERQRLQDKVTMLKDRSSTLQEHSKTLQAAKEESNLELMFKIHQDVRDLRAGPPIRVREVDDGIMTTFSFNARDESILASRIKNFGDISSQVESRYSGRAASTLRSMSTPNNNSSR